MAVDQNENSSQTKVPVELLLEDDTPALDTNMQSDLTTAGGATVDGEKNLAAILARTV